MNEITEWILASFVAGYIAGLISAIFIFIKIHHRIREMPHTPIDPHSGQRHASNRRRASATIRGQCDSSRNPNISWRR